MKFIIENGKRIAKEIYVNFSNIADEEAEKAKNAANAKLVQIGKEYAIPFRVPNALKVTGYIDDLSKHRKLEIKKQGGYKYWHTIKTYKIEYL